MMKSRTTVLVLALGLGALLASPASAAEYDRRDVTLGKQVQRAELVLTGTVLGLQPASTPDALVATISVGEVLKGASPARVQVLVTRGDSVSPDLEIGAQALFILGRGAESASDHSCGCVEGAADEGESHGMLRPDRGRRSVMRLDRSGGHDALELVRAHLDLARAPARLRSALVRAVESPSGWLATDAAYELRTLVESGVALPEADAAILLTELREDPARFSDLDPLIELAGSHPAARDTLLQTIARPGRFQHVHALATTLARRGDPQTAQVLAANMSRNTSARIRSRVARLAGALGDARLAPDVARATRDRDGSVRTEALLALGELGGDASLATLREALVDVDRTLLERRVAAVALARLGRPGVEALLEADAGELAPFVDRLRRSPSRARHEVLRALNR